VKVLLVIAALVVVLFATGNVHFYFTSSAAGASAPDELQALMDAEHATDRSEAVDALYRLASKTPRTPAGARLVRTRAPELVRRFDAAARDVRARVSALDVATPAAQRFRKQVLRIVARQQWAVTTFADELARLHQTWPAVSRLDGRMRAINRDAIRQLNPIVDAARQ
jgi:hypothetical protein